MIYIRKMNGTWYITNIGIKDVSGYGLIRMMMVMLVFIKSMIWQHVHSSNNVLAVYLNSRQLLNLNNMAPIV